jgi:CheY-like chemotaxis protein
MSPLTANHPCYLIVDDSPLNLQWLARTLANIGPCEIIQASDGLEAVDKLASTRGRIDAIISDFRMPRMNGLELLKEVRLARTGARQSTPFLIVTSFSERALAGLALGLDVDAFLARPIKKQALDRHLTRTCAERRVDKSAAEARSTYADVDLSLSAISDAEPSAAAVGDTGAPTSQGGQPGASVAVLDEKLVALETVPEGARLTRDAINTVGSVLVKAGEPITGSLKAVLLSYSEIDESLAKVWVEQ